jgi:prefoldin alpha subunit
MARKGSTEELMMVTAQLQRLQAYLQAVEEQLQEVTLALEGVEELGKAKAGSEVYAPLAEGIYVKARLLESKDYLVNIGEGVTVKKTASQVKEILGKQLQELQAVQENLVGEFSQAYQRYAQLQMKEGE